MKNIFNSLCPFAKKMLLVVFLLGSEFSMAVEILEASEVLSGTDGVELAPRTFGNGGCILTRKIAHQDGKNLVIEYDASQCRSMIPDHRMRLVTTEGEFILKNISNFTIGSNPNPIWVPANRSVYFAFKPGRRLSDDALQYSAIKADMCVSFQCIQDSNLLDIISDKIHESARSASLNTLAETSAAGVTQADSIQNSPRFGDFDGVSADGSLKSLDWLINGINQKFKNSKSDFINGLMSKNFLYLKSSEINDFERLDAEKKLIVEKRQFLENILNGSPKSIANEMVVFRPIKLIKYDDSKGQIVVREQCQKIVNYNFVVSCKSVGSDKFDVTDDVLKKFGDDGELLNQGKAQFTGLGFYVSSSIASFSFSLERKNAMALFDLAKSASNTKFNTHIDLSDVGTILMAKIKYSNKGMSSVNINNGKVNVEYAIKAVELCIYDATGSDLVVCKKVE